MRTAIITREDGSQILVTEYANGSLTLAERSSPDLYPVSVWGPPHPITFDPPYDYLTRPIEELLGQHGSFL